MPVLAYGETRINTSLNGYQDEPAVTVLTDGGHVASLTAASLSALT